MRKNLLCGVRIKGIVNSGDVIDCPKGNSPYQRISNTDWPRGDHPGRRCLPKPFQGFCFTAEWDQPNRSRFRREKASQIVEQARLIVLGTVKGIQKSNCIHVGCGILPRSPMFVNSRGTLGSFVRWTLLPCACSYTLDAAGGARLEYLPPYSPDFNPIENLWSKVKQGLKSRDPRTARQLLAAASAVFDTVTREDCHGFFCHAGYATCFMERL